MGWFDHIQWVEDAHWSSIYPILDWFDIQWVEDVHWSSICPRLDWFSILFLNLEIYSAHDWINSFFCSSIWRSIVPTIGLIKFFPYRSEDDEYPRLDSLHSLKYINIFYTHDCNNSITSRLLRCCGYSLKHAYRREFLYGTIVLQII